MWGIPNSDIIYRTGAARGGELTSIDEYSSASADFLVTTGSGLMYKESTGEISLPSVNVDIRRRLATSRLVGPFFSNTALQTRKMGADNITNFELPVTSITNNGDGTASVVLNIENKVGTLDDLVAGFDILTIRETEHSEYSGSWTITSINNITNTLDITVPGLVSYVPNETDTGAYAGIYSDALAMSPTDDEGNTLDLPFAVGDTVNSTLFEVSPPVVTAVSGTTLWLDGILETSSLPSGARISADRTSNVIKVDEISEIVRGDMLQISGYTRKARVQEVDVVASTVTIDEPLLVSDSPINRTTISVPGRWVTIEAPKYNKRKFIHWDTNDTTNQTKINTARIRDRKSTRLNSSHSQQSRMPSSA